MVIYLKNALEITTLTILTEICDKNGKFKALNFSLADCFHQAIIGGYDKFDKIHSERNSQVQI